VAATVMTNAIILATSVTAARHVFQKGVLDSRL